MYQTIYTMHAINDEHLQAVIAYMHDHGAPTIRIVDCGDHYQAIEGNHRLHAAALLRVTPNFVVLDQDDEVAGSSLDWDSLNADETYSAGDLAGKAFGSDSESLTFDF